MTSRLQVIVSGVVQGVCFRDFTRRQALALGLAGWVRNLPDGRVQAVVQGDKTALDQFLVRLRAGPPSSRVDSLAVTWAETQGSFQSFEIRY